MEVKFYNQPKDVKLADILKDKLCSGNFKNIWFVAGYTKDDGLEFFLPDFDNALKTGASISFVLGLDRKNTSKSILETLLSRECKIRAYLNNDDNDKFETRVFAFEGIDNKDFIYLTATKFSENGFLDSKCLVTEIIYTNERKEFNKFKASLESGFSGNDFFELNSECLKELASNGDIVARITERKIPRISDMYGTSAAQIGEEQYNEESSANIFNNLLDDVEIDVDLPSSDSIKVQATLGEEVEQKIEKKKSSEEENVQTVSKILKNENEWDYDNMNSLIYQVDSKAGITREIKILNSIASNMNKFFDYPNSFHTVEDEKGKVKECHDISLEIFDNVTKSEKIDKCARIYKTDRYTAIYSELFSDLYENDIIRFVRKSQNLFRCEIIHLNTDEYTVWDGFCRTPIKGSSRKFGII